MKLYDDPFATASLAPNAAVKGHVIIQPKRPARRLSDLPADECAHLFTIANYTAAILFQGLQAEGTNIICNEEEDQLTIHVLARRQDDGLNFQWQPQELPPDEMSDAFERIKDKAFYVGHGKGDKPDKPATKEKADQHGHKGGAGGAPPSTPRSDEKKGAASPEDAAVAEEEERENYLIRQLIRIP